MSGSALRVAMVAACGALGACELPTSTIPPAESQLIVEAVLDANSVVQIIRVERSQPGFGTRTLHVTGAVVTITTPTSQTFTANDLVDPNFGAIGFYYVGVSAVLPMVAGWTYTLRVHTPAGEDVIGTTTMPRFTTANPPLDVFPIFDRARDTLRLAWPAVALAKRYEIVVRGAITGSNGSIVRSYSAFTDTSVTLAGDARTLGNEPVFLDHTTTLVQVSAVDDNYYTYYHANVDPFAGAPPSRLTGALGVFGAIAPVLKREYLETR